jgi:hypothetical protein
MAKRKKVIQHRDPLGRTYEEEEPDDSILQDGQTLRVSMFLRDGSPNPLLSEVQRAVAATQTRKLLVDDGTGNSLNLHKPGFRVSANPAERAAADAALTAAYDEVEARDASAWRTDTDTGSHPLLVNKRGLSPGKLECVADSQDAQSVEDAREAAYRLYDEEQQNAWRTS